MKSSRANVRLASFWLTGLLFCQRLPASLAGPVPPAKNQPLKIPGDCKPRTVGQATKLTFCLDRPADPMQRGYFSIQVEKNNAPVYQTRASWIPEANEDLDAVAVLGINQRWLGISYDFCECTVVKVIDLERKQLALDTGCWHAGYYGIKEFPEKDRCEVVLQSGEGDNNPVVRPGHRYDICRRRVDLSKTGRALHPSFSCRGGPRIYEKMPVKPILPVEAAGIARDRLEEKGVKDVVIYRARWIAAPLTGYLVDAAGSWQVGKERFSLFRIGVRDGSEEAFGERAPGEEFVFLATGTDEKNRRIWHPELGPDHRVPNGASAPDTLPVYNYLLDDRESFENLPLLYADKQSFEFAILDAKGTKLLADMPGTESRKFNMAVCQGGNIHPVGYLGEQKATPRDSGRMTSANFKNLFGQLYGFAGFDLGSQQLEADPCLLISESFLSDSRSVLKKGRPPGKCRPEELDRVKALGKTGIKQCTRIADLGDSGQVVLAVFARDGEAMPARVALVSDRILVLKDLSGRWDPEQGSCWRVDDGCEFRPEFVRVLLAFQHYDAITVGLAWDGAEGQNLYLVRAGHERVDPVCEKYRYWSP